MPSLPFALGPFGAVVSILIRPGEESSRALRDAGLAVPEAVSTIAFVDTGASHTTVERGLNLFRQIKALNGYEVRLLGLAQPQNLKAYDVEIAVAADDLFWVPVRAAAGTVAHSGTNAALGRDFLAHFRFTYDGPKGEATLAWGS